MTELRDFFRKSLLDDTMRFWTAHGVDREQGGFFTFVDRAGGLLDSDKGVWIQGRATWLYSRLYNEIERRPEWLAIARSGAEFLSRHCFDADGRMFFKVTRDGRPLVKRRYAFSEVFAVIGFAEYARASGDASYLERARDLARFVEHLLSTPGMLPPKIDPRTRQLRSHSIAMIRVNMYQVLRNADPQGAYDGMIDAAIEDLFRYFVKPDKMALYETVGMQGELLDSPSGRCLNPGHAIDTSWFLMHEGASRKNAALVERAIRSLKAALERGWDPRYGGILYFVDAEGKQAEQLEWDMKLWWVHTEAIYATLLAHSLTGESVWLDEFEKTLEWSLHHFPDPEHGEWFGYLHRDGSVALDFKANNWKGMFHLPRQQLLCYQLLDDMIRKGQGTSTRR